MKVDYKRYPVTMITIAICIIMYIYTTMRYGVSLNALQAQEVGGFNPVLVLEYHQYYRLILANFIHFDLMHIVCNCYALYGLGMILEGIVGTKRYACILIGSMLTTTLLPCALYMLFSTGAFTIMGGISGAIFGVMGALLIMGLIYKERYLFIFKQMAGNVLIMIVISVLVPSISLVGHVSGLVGGIIIMFIIIKCWPISNWKPRIHEEPYNNLVN